MKLSGHTGFSIFLILIAGYVIYAASHWSFKTGFFPLAVAIPLVILSVAHLFLEIFAPAEQASGPAVEAEFSTEVPPEVARQRVIAVFSWIAGFILLVFLLGFRMAVLVFIFSYLKIQSQVSWLRSTALTAATWAFFYVVFQRLVHLQFEDGIIQTWLGM
jgi:hypothetical protein